MLPFDNRTGDPQYDVMEKGLSDMLLTDLSAAEGLTVVERARLTDVIAELKLQRSSLFDPSTVQKVGKLAGATHVVTGQLLKVDPDVRLDVRLVEVASGKVLYGANVAGKPDRLFDLEQELVTRFLDGLGRKGVLPKRSGPAKLETLLAYSQALAQADNGDLKEASASLAAVMKTDADFRLAKERYTDILKRVREAAAHREDVLSQGEQELLARIDSVLSTPLDYSNKKAVGVYLGYRALRANFALMRLRKLTGPDSLPTNPALVALVKKSQRPAARALLSAYFDGWLTFFDEAERTHAGPEKTPDHELAKELQLGSYADEGHTGSYAYQELADFVFTGETRNYDVMRHLAPKPFELEPKLVEPALALYVKAASLANAGSQSDRLEFGARVAISHGLALLALGRKEEAMARWQQALDEMPTTPHYKAIEEHIEKTLGIGPAWKALDDANKVCDQNLMSAWFIGGYALYAYDPEGLFARAEKVPKLCGKKPPQAWYPASGFRALGDVAARAGDCPRYLRATARARAYSADFGKTLEQYGTACVEAER